MVPIRGYPTGRALRGAPQANIAIRDAGQTAASRFHHPELATLHVYSIKHSASGVSVRPLTMTNPSDVRNGHSTLAFLPMSPSGSFCLTDRRCRRTCRRGVATGRLPQALACPSRSWAQPRGALLRPTDACGPPGSVADLVVVVRSIALVKCRLRIWL
jgi:hypothetical protein